MKQKVHLKLGLRILAVLFLVLAILLYIGESAIGSWSVVPLTIFGVSSFLVTTSYWVQDFRQSDQEKLNRNPRPPPPDTW